MVTIDFKLADIKVVNSEAYLLKLRKNLSSDFEVILKHVFVKVEFQIYADISYIQSTKKQITFS